MSFEITAKSGLLPPILYKYRPFNCRTVRMLKKGQIYYSSPKEFNDPFDCLGREMMTENFEESLIDYHASISNLRHELVRQILKNDQTHQDAKKNTHNRVNLLKNYGVCSLSSSRESILMWSHYADSHKGFCIGFNTSNIEFQDAKKVKYIVSIDKNFLFNNYQCSPEEFESALIEESFLKKYVDWEYEEEWRLIKSQRGIIVCSNDCIESIIFGLSMTQRKRNIIMNLTKKKDVKYYETIRSDGNIFALDVLPLA